MNVKVTYSWSDLFIVTYFFVLDGSILLDCDNFERLLFSDGVCSFLVFVLGTTFAKNLTLAVLFASTAVEVTTRLSERQQS